MAIATAAEFFAILRKSKLLDAAQLDNAHRLVAADRPGAERDDPTAIAKTLAREGLVTRWQAGQLLAGRGSFFLGKYKLLELLGRSTSGDVFLGQHVRMNRRVALKILSRQVRNDPASLKRFLSEARTVAGLDHNNIVRAYSVDNEGDRYYLVMEHVEGRNLRDIVEQDGLPDFAAVAEMIRQVADGLAHGHQRQVIHGNVRPSNLLVNAEGVVKIAAMGLAHLTGEDQLQRQETTGAVDYTAPEQALGAAGVDHRADIYSLGCTLYFLLTGQPPFAEGTLPQRILKHQTSEPRSILETRPDAPPELVAICQQMMAKNPDERPQSAELVGRMVSDWQSSVVRAESARPPRIVQAAEEEEEEPAIEMPSIHIHIDVDRKLPPDSTEEPAGKADQLSAAKGNRLRPWHKVAIGTVASLAVGGILAVAIIWMAKPSEESQPKDNSQARGELDPVEPTEPGQDEPPTEEPVDKPDGQPDASPPEDGSQPPAADPAEDQPGPDLADLNFQEPDKRPEDAPPEEEREPDAPTAEQPPEETALPKPPSEPPPTEPFADLAAAVDLPPLAASGNEPPEPVSLGLVHVGPNDSVALQLLGGKEAIRGSREFVIRTDKPGMEWSIQLQATGRSASTPDSPQIARIRLNQEELWFRWEESAEDAGGAFLRNAGLLITVGEQTHWLPLARPVEIDPMVLDLDLGGARTALPLTAAMPRLESLNLRVTQLVGPFPKHELTPANATSTDGMLSIPLQGDGLPKVELQLALVARMRTATLELAIRYQLIDGHWYPLQYRQMMNQLALGKRDHERLQAITDKMPKSDPRRAPIREQREAMKVVVEQIETLGDLYQDLHNAGKVHVRVFHTIDDRQVDLFVTSSQEKADTEE